jgi:hypothetical protein
MTKQDWNEMCKIKTTEYDNDGIQQCWQNVTKHDGMTWDSSMGCDWRQFQISIQCQSSKVLICWYMQVFAQMIQILNTAEGLGQGDIQIVCRLLLENDKC